jgi:hypothetical protein
MMSIPNCFILRLWQEKIIGYNKVNGRKIKYVIGKGKKVKAKREKLLRVSASTIDRLLRPEKDRYISSVKI